MSRSKRKPYFTDQQTNSPGGRVKQAKRAANKAVRQVMKKAITDDKEHLANGKAYCKASNSWDIRDWYFYAPKDPKASRK